MTDSHVDAGVDDVTTSTQPDNDGTHNELALLLPGQTLRIQIGDVSASRKAWKKRRRNASPILVPCSVLGVNREWMVRWNVVTLLHAIGEVSGDAGGAVSITAGKLGRAYRQRLGGDLRDHAAALGHASADALLRSLFDDAIRAEYGVRTFVEPVHGNLVLATCVSRRQARQFSAAAGLVQFCPDATGGDGDYRMLHTGLAAVPLASSAGKKPRFAEEPLGAALRVSPLDQAAERYQPGDELNAFVYSYNARGDNELPLLVLTADDPRGKGAAVGSGTFGSFTRVFKRRSMEGAGGDLAEDAGIERGLTDLSTGDGPFAATVVAVSSHSSAAFVDCGVGRKRGKRLGGGVKKVLGMLRFEDLCREDATAATGDATDVAAGDKIQVYIKAVSPQSGRFMVTLDPSVKDTKPKDLKRAQRADKRQERLSKKWAAEDVEALVGTVCDGTVKARSKTGNWYYVQPEGGAAGVRDGQALPVGVARGEGGGGPYAAGDRVRVRVEGVERGQLALSLLE